MPWCWVLQHGMKYITSARALTPAECTRWRNAIARRCAPDQALMPAGVPGEDAPMGGKAARAGQAPRPAGVRGGESPLGGPPPTMRSARRCADLMATFSSGVCMSCKVEFSKLSRTAHSQPGIVRLQEWPMLKAHAATVKLSMQYFIHKVTLSTLSLPLHAGGRWMCSAQGKCFQA